MQYKNTTHPEQLPAGQTAQRQKEDRHNTPAGCAGGANTEKEHRIIAKPTKKKTNSTMINNLPRTHSTHDTDAERGGARPTAPARPEERGRPSGARAGERSGRVRVEGGRGFGQSPTNPKKDLTLTENDSQKITKIAGVVDRLESVYARAGCVSAVWRCAKTQLVSVLALQPLRK